MSLWIEWETETENAATDEMNAVLEKAVMTALQEENVTAPVEISLRVVDEEEIRSINAEFREIDSVTDVLSFPMLEYEEGEVPAERVQRALEEQETDPETGEVVLGDIVIGLKRAMEQAEAYGHSLKREMAFLAVHSVLHLLGYDHMVKEEETVMFARQEAILEAAGLPR